MSSFAVALIQLCSRARPRDNIETVSDLVRRAAAAGADLVCTPETSSLMARNREELFAAITTEEQDPALAAWRAVARETQVWLLAGSLIVRVAQDKAADKAANRSLLLSPNGDIAARYDKIHLFDVTLPTGETHRESESYQPGSQIVTARLPWGTLGMSICYDLRFPVLYRTLARRGAGFLSVPSAFTVPTGEAHWHTLLRARAIENACFVFAPAQAGAHENGRRTYGHSLVINPWGEILAEADDRPEQIITARIDPGEVDKARTHIPVLQHETTTDKMP